MTKGVTEGEDTVKDTTQLDFVRKYLALSREYQPKLTPAAQKYIATEHARKRDENTGGSDSLRSHRQVNSLTRLATAVAKFDFSHKATMAHVKYAENILSESLEEKDPNLLTTGTTLAEANVTNKVKELIKVYFTTLTTEQQGKTHTLEDIHAKISEGMTVEGGWRPITLGEIRKYATALADEVGNSIETISNDKFMLLGGETL